MIRHFIKNSVVVAGSVGLVLLLLLFAVPRDRNAYLESYRQKTALLYETPCPRAVFIGYSQLAFGLDCKMIADSTGLNAINLSLQEGASLRYMAEAYLSGIRSEGDMVFIQPSYTADFIDGGNGLQVPLLDVMLISGFQHLSKLNKEQWRLLLEGVPAVSYRNLVRLLKSPVKGFDTPVSRDYYIWNASGFNEYGDEASHWMLPAGMEVQGLGVAPPEEVMHVNVDSDFIAWLQEVVATYRSHGARVFIMPEIGTESSYHTRYSPDFDAALSSVGLSFMCAPSEMTVSDEYAYNSPQHLNREGAAEISSRLIHFIKINNP